LCRRRISNSKVLGISSPLKNYNSLISMFIINVIVGVKAFGNNQWPLK
jgi:hypothetical protein